MTTKAELLKRIRRNCTECMGGQASFVPGCTSPKCQFFDFRMGKDPRPSKAKQEIGARFGKFYGYRPSTEMKKPDENQRKGI